MIENATGQSPGFRNEKNRLSRAVARQADSRGNLMFDAQIGALCLMGESRNVALLRTLGPCHGWRPIP